MVVGPVAQQNLDGYGAPVIPWPRVLECLQAGWSQRGGSGGPGRHTCWLATTNRDGSPHVTALGARWIDGSLYFNAGPATRKAINLAATPTCALTLSTEKFDLVVEGEARRVSDREEIDRIGAVYAALGWSTLARDGGLALVGDFSAPSAGKPPWDVYALRPKTIVAVGCVEPFGATRWRF